MKRILFFTTQMISHIKPIILFLKILNKNSDVYCVGISSFQDLIEETGVTFVPYPGSFFSRESCKSKEKVLAECESRMQVRLSKIQEATEIDEDLIEIFHDLVHDAIKKQSLDCYGFNDACYDVVKEIIEGINPNLILRDSQNVYAGAIAKDKKIKCVSYLTNNMYSFEYLNSAKRYLYSHFFRITDVLSLLSDQYYESLERKITEIFAELAEELQMPQIAPFPSYNLDDDINLIYSLPCLHPPKGKYEKEGKKYLFLPPAKNSFRLNGDEVICSKLQEFMATNEKIVYIATGSFWSRESSFYEFWINFFLSKGYKIIVSWNPDAWKLTAEGSKKSEIKDFESFPADKVFVDQELPQKYILDHADIFLTAGGWNSVLEAIYYNTPMLFSPFTPEQNMTGLLMEDLGLGVTLFKQRERAYNADELFAYFLNKISGIKDKMEEIKNSYCEEAALVPIAEILLQD